MEQQPGHPPARTVGMTAATGDLLVILLRRWHEVAAEALPGDHALTELLTTRLRDLAAGPAPQEADLLAITEEAVQHAIGCGAADAARQLSKRLRRAIYEYLLSLDAMSPAEVAVPPLGPFPGTPAFARSARDSDRPELVWDEPELRVLEGGAKVAPPEAPDGEAAAEPPPAIEAPELAEHEREEPAGESDEAHQGSAWAAPVHDHPDDTPAAEERPHLHLVVDPVGALRVPEVFRRADLDVDADAPVNPFAPPKSTPQVVPSYSAWADVLASEPDEVPEAAELPTVTAPAPESNRFGSLQARLAATRRAGEGEEDAKPEVTAESAPVDAEGKPELEPAVADDDEHETQQRKESEEFGDEATADAALTADAHEEAEAVAEPEVKAKPDEDAEPEAQANADEDGDWPWLAKPEAVAEDWLETAAIEPWSPDGSDAGDPAVEADADAGAEAGAEHDDVQAGDESAELTWSIRPSPRQQALQKRLAERRRDEVIRAAAEAFDDSAASRPGRHRLPELVRRRLPDQVDGLLRRKRAGEAAALVQRAAQEIAGREIADLALECGDRCRDRRQTRAAINSYLAAWRADPVYEAPLWRLAETCLADREIELAVGYLERIADLMRARGDDEGAIEVYRKVVEVAPDRGDMRALLQAAESRGRFPD